jgi:flagellar biosynthesis GTPase FlhF
MRNALHFFVTLCCFIFPVILYSQSCDHLMAKDQLINGIHHLQTKSQTMVVRGNYIYSLELVSDNKGLSAVFYSKGGVRLHQNDELIFIDIHQKRNTYRFSGIITAGREGNAPVNSNWLQLDLEAVKWMATNEMAVLYIKNNQANEMRKFTMTSARQREFKQLAACFLAALQKDKIIESDIESSDAAPWLSDEKEKKDQKKQTAEAPPLNDQELRDLRRELEATKQKIREQIEAEYQKAEEVKQQIAEEILLARKAAAKQKKRLLKK